MGSLVGVDITQGVGIIPFDVQAAGTDFVVGSTLKWLCGVAGAGVLQVRERCCASAGRSCAGGSARRIRSRGRSIRSSTHAMRGGSITARRRYCHAPRVCPRSSGMRARIRAALRAHNLRLVEAAVEGCATLRLELISPANAEIAAAA